MSFRDLEDLNKAMLAKQGWHLIQNPGSLVAVILKEKYYPAVDIRQAQLGSNPSYAWRSIFKARDVLERGLLWRVVNGEDIRIWGDKWLLTPPTHKVQSPCRGLDPDARVSSLIDSSSGWWNYALIRDIFNEEEAEHICNLILSPLM